MRRRWWLAMVALAGATLAHVAMASGTEVARVTEHAVRGDRVQLQFAPADVTFVADSGLKGIELHGGVPLLSTGLPTTTWTRDMQTCRRLVQEGCSFNRLRPPRPAIEAIGHPRSASHVLLMTAGHNDHPSWFLADFERIMLTARARGFQRVAWILYRDEIYPGLSSLGQTLARRYRAMNDILIEQSSSGRWPELVLLDYRSATRDHPDWFISDGIHLTPTGGIELGLWFAQQMQYSSNPGLRVEP